MNLSYTRPTYVLAKDDKDKQEALKKDFESFKNTLMVKLITYYLKTNL
ncbi:winged helix-turn-helix domain-containing protein [Clostridium manihotivorum]|nr:winged helix-turn-helix domain-containing protein [Clostridium manihotivorum]